VIIGVAVVRLRRQRRQRKRPRPRRMTTPWSVAFAAAGLP